MLIFALMMFQDAPIALTCGGTGTARKVRSSTVYGTDSNGNTAQGTVTSVHGELFNDQVDVQINSEESRIRLPRTMLPVLRGGEDGWFKLRDVRVTDSAIDGSAAVNFINKPKVHIDRRTGTISIDGKAGHYTGMCERALPDAPRKF
jgi:hypothetical protein